MATKLWRKAWQECECDHSTNSWPVTQSIKQSRYIIIWWVHVSLMCVSINSWIICKKLYIYKNYNPSYSMLFYANMYEEDFLWLHVEGFKRQSLVLKLNNFMEKFYRVVSTWHACYCFLCWLDQRTILWMELIISEAFEIFLVMEFE